VQEGRSETSCTEFGVGAGDYDKSFQLAPEGGRQAESVGIEFCDFAAE